MTHFIDFSTIDLLQKVLANVYKRTQTYQAHSESVKNAPNPNICVCLCMRMSVYRVFYPEPKKGIKPFCYSPINFLILYLQFIKYHENITIFFSSFRSF